MRRFTVVLSIFLIFLMASSVYASDIFETGVWRKTGVLNNGIRYGIRAMTEDEKAIFQLREAVENAINVSEGLDLFDTQSDVWRETGKLSNGIRYGIRAMTEEEKAIFQLREATQNAVKVSEESDLFDVQSGVWKKTGVLSNGMRYGVRDMTEEEKAALQLWESAKDGIITPLCYSWSGNVNVPIANSTGTNGRQLGSNFIIAPDRYAFVFVGSLPSIMPTVNIGARFTNGMGDDWIPNVGANEVVMIDPGHYNNYEMAIRVSTYENASASARFSITTGN